MPYSSVSDLPSDIKDNLPTGAQKIFVAAFNSAFKEHQDEVSANKIAWSAVKMKYRRAGDGKWMKKEFQVLGKMMTTPAYSAPSPLVRENMAGPKRKKKPAKK